MAKPVLPMVDDHPQVLRAVERDLRRRDARSQRPPGRGGFEESAHHIINGPLHESLFAARLLVGARQNGG